MARHLLHAWSAVNKARVARLEAAGRMTPPGSAAVAAARADGAWRFLDAVEALEIPPDLAAALDEAPAAAAKFAGFPRSAKRGILECIAQARRPEIRAARVAETARRARAGERANQYQRKPP
ncbi:MAG: YdeI/OmpD-associated family protein [Rhodobacteraceae bacterium]|nr:YdeI/OmpD-associated family protein [Paracoccaceae bacterium]